MAAIEEVGFDEFLAAWGAHVQANGDPFTPEQVAELDRHHVWTITDDDDAYPGFVAIPGTHIDDRYGHCVTRKPWTADFRRAGSYAVWKQTDRLGTSNDSTVPQPALPDTRHGLPHM